MLGLSRRTGLDQIVMASTVAGVLRRARCPVLAVAGQSAAAELDRFDNEAVALFTLGATHGVAASNGPKEVETL